MANDHHSDLLRLHAYMGFGQSAPSDREFAIVCASYVEKHLGNLLMASLPGWNDKLEEKLFRPERPLGTTGARLDIAAAMNLLAPNMHNDMVLMSQKQIRP